jgi:hypothetical protein
MSPEADFVDRFERYYSISSFKDLLNELIEKAKIQPAI